MKLFELKELTSNMRKSKKDIEQFYVSYNNIQFDVIYDISKSPFDLLIGAVGINWACILKIERGFTTQMGDKDFYELCRILNLKPYLSYIKAVNTIIGKTKHKKFVYILDYLKQNNELRDFHYDLVLKELNDNNIPQNLK